MCLILFCFLCVGMICFLRIFTEFNNKIQYVDWQTAVKIENVEKETPIDYSVKPTAGDKFRFEAVVFSKEEYGNLIFETAGTELQVFLNGEEVWRSRSVVPNGAVNQTQAIIPLPLNTECRLEMFVTVINTENLIFPPFLRFVPVDADAADDYAYANYYGIPAGATAFIALMIAGLFIFGIIQKKTDWSLIPLFLSAVGLTVRWITKGMGGYFLNKGFVEIMSRQAIGILFVALLAVYLVMNRRRRFWKYFGVSAAISALTLLAAYGVSAVCGGGFAQYINGLANDIVEFNSYDRLLYWVTVWLTAVCAVISAYAALRSIIAQRLEAQTLCLKNKLIMDSYHAIESKMTDSAAMRHEERHRIIALCALYRKKDYKALGNLLDEIKEQSDSLSKTWFTENFTVNAILQDASYRAAQKGILFDAFADVPKELDIAERDLCELLMNMLDNAIEGAESSKSDKFIRFRIEEKKSFLAVKCENSFSGNVRRDSGDGYATLKDDRETHGFGLKIMNNVAEKYGSMLDIFTSEDDVFTVQTALKLPKKTIEQV